MAVTAAASDGLIDESRPGSPPDDAARSAVVARGLFKIYKEGATETVALRGADLELGRGEFVSIVGPSGSGKSTLLWILAGLILPSAGSVLMDGRDITRLDEAARAELRAAHLGVVFQKGNLVPFLTAHENVELAMRMQPHRGADSARAQKLLTELGLGGRLHSYPRQLSGGEAQRVAIAVALANQPAILLGDEVTGELDTATSAHVMEILLGVQRDRGLAMLLVTHNPAVAALAGRRLAIIDGLVEELV